LSKKNCQTLPPKFGKVKNEICQKFYPFCSACMKMSEMQQILNEIFKSVLPNLAKIFWSVTEFNKNYEILRNLTKFHES
jgi:hypothetical protein